MRIQCHRLLSTQLIRTWHCCRRQAVRWLTEHSTRHLRLTIRSTSCTAKLEFYDGVIKYFESNGYKQIKKRTALVNLCTPIYFSAVWNELHVNSACVYARSYGGNIRSHVRPAVHENERTRTNCSVQPHVVRFRTCTTQCSGTYDA